MGQLTFLGLRGLSLAVLIISAGNTSAMANEDFYKRLAAYHAPVFYQETGSNPRADAITRYNFDGDWVANNNWDNLDKFKTPAYVYYSVVETKTHYFITYAFYHPRDYQTVCFWKACHENDLEGAFFTVTKDPDNEYGDVFFVATIAHIHILGYPNPKTTLAPQPDIFGRERRIALRAEGGGHGIYNWDDFPSNGQRYVYYYGGVSDDPNGKKTGYYRYDLLPISTELWARRDQVGRGKIWEKNFNYIGARFKLGPVPEAFAGEKFGRGMAHAPWAWEDSSEVPGIQRGDWFFDPAHTVYTRLGEPRGWNLDYVNNPYLGISDQNFDKKTKIPQN
jgi:hypothetical protein